MAAPTSWLTDGCLLHVLTWWKAPPDGPRFQTPLHWGLEFQHVNLGGDTNIPSRSGVREGVTCPVAPGLEPRPLSGQCPLSTRHCSEARAAGDERHTEVFMLPRPGSADKDTEAPPLSFTQKQEATGGDPLLGAPPPSQQRARQSPPLLGVEHSPGSHICPHHKAGAGRSAPAGQGRPAAEEGGIDSSILGVNATS